MAAPAVSAGEEQLVERIDTDWLRRVAGEDPLPHAFAVWDLANAPDRVRFVSLLRAGRTVGYLLAWYGTRGIPVVHWVSRDPGDGRLREGLPRPPVVAVVPERVVGDIRTTLGESEVYPIELMEYVGAPPPAPDPRVRRLTPADRGVLRTFAGRSEAQIGQAYEGVDPGRDRVWGAFAGARLVAAARTSVALPSVWFLSGIFTDPEHRNQGYGRAVTIAATREGLGAGARVALYVRSDNTTARATYRGAGFRAIERRAWVDARAHQPP